MREQETLKAELVYWQRVIGDRMGANDRRFSDMVRDLKDMLVSAPRPIATEDGAKDLCLALRQARYALRDFDAKQPGCGFSKLADACSEAADTIAASYTAPTTDTIDALIADNVYVDNDGVAGIAAAAEAVYASLPRSTAMTASAEPVAVWQWRFHLSNQWSNVVKIEDYRSAYKEELAAGKIVLRALYATPSDAAAETVDRKKLAEAIDGPNWNWDAGRHTAAMVKVDRVLACLALSAAPVPVWHELEEWRAARQVIFNTRTTIEATPELFKRLSDAETALMVVARSRNDREAPNA